MATKANDWFATIMFQPNMSIDDLYSVGITPDNASLKDKDYYKGIKEVRDIFSDENGNFNEVGFNSAYDTSALLYNDYANKLSMNQLEKTYKYDPFDWRYVEKDKENVTPTMSFEKNPMRTSVNTKALNTISDSGWSIREIAQTEKVFNYDKGVFEDWTPNDKGGLFKALGRDSLVLATWDEDGTHTDDQGRIIAHKKGEYKYHPITGRPYYETLGDREGYDKDFLHISDTLTKEGTKINKFDFFDSDGLDKSVGGSMMKLTASIAPTLLGLVAPPIGIAYGGISAAIALSQLMPTLGKAINGFITNNNQNGIGKALNKAEAYTSRFAKSVSDKSREHTITFENAASLINDVAMQLFQQRAVQYIPRLFKNNPNIYNNAKLARTLSYAYMSGTSALESYSAFKQAGADDRVAGLGMMATMAAFYKIMSIEYFRDSFFKGSWFDDNNVKSPVWNVADDFMKTIQRDGSKEIAKDVAENTAVANKKTLSELTKRFVDALKQTGKPWRPMPFWERAFAEGTEEVMEEAMQDSIKALFNAAEALGVPMNKEREKLDFGWSIEDAIKRYGMSFAGGFVGGAIFQGYNYLETGRVNPIIGSDAHLSELVKLISDGRGDEIRSVLERWHNQGRFGSTDLSGTKLAVANDVNGNRIIAMEASDDNISQNDFIYQSLLRQVKYVENVLNEEGFKTLQSTLEDAVKKVNPQITSSEVAADLATKLKLHSLVYKDLNRLGTKIVQIHKKIDDRTKEISPKTDAQNTAENREKVKKDQVIKDYEAELKELQKERDAILNGDRLSYYVDQSVLSLNGRPLTPFLGFSDLASFVRARFGKNISELSKAQKELAEEEYKSYKDGDKADIFAAIDVYRAFASELAKNIEDAEKDLGNATSDSDLRPTTIGTQFINHLKTRDAYIARKAELEAKAELSDEESSELAGLQDKIDVETKQIDFIRRNPQRTLYNETANANSLIEKFQRILNENPENVGVETIAELGNDIKEAYIRWANSNTLKRSESELSSLLQLVGRKAPTDSQRWENISNWLNDYIDRIGSGWEDLSDKIRSAIIGNPDPTEEEIALFEQNGGFEQNSLFNWDGVHDKNEKQKQFESLINKFYSELSSDLGSTLRNYNDIIEFLHQQGLSDEEIENVLYTDFGNGSIISFIGDEKLPDYLRNVAELRKNIKRSVLPKLLSGLTAQINDESVITIFDMLDSEQKRLASQTELDTYIMSSQSEAALKNALYLLNALKGLIVGASDGSNHKMNEYRNSEKLAEISKNTAALLSDEIDEYINRISFLLALHAKNNGMKLSEHKDIAVNMRVKFLEKLVDAIHSEPFKDQFGFDPKGLWEDHYRPSDFDSISVDNYYKFEPIIIDFETELFNKVKALNLTSEEIADKIFNIFGENVELWKQASTKISKDKDLIVGDYDFAYYLMSVLTLNANDFYAKIKPIINDKFQKAPIYGHEYIVRMAYAMYLNPGGFNEILTHVKNTYKGSDEYIKNRKKISNILFAFGGAGTGKTTSVAKLFKLLVEDEADIVYLATGQEQLNKLTESVEAEEGSHKETYDEFFKNVAGDQLNPTKLSKNDNGETVVEKLIPNNKYQIVDSNKKKHVFICDEIETANELQLQLLSSYADDNDIFVLAIGDYKQPSGKLQIQDKVYNSGTEDLYIIKTPTLTASLRTLSVAKNDNYNKLDTLIDEIEQEIRTNPEKYLDPTNLNALVESKLAKGTVLDYFEDNNTTRIVGDKVINNDSDFKDRLDKAISMSTKNAKVLIVCDEKSESKYQADTYKSNPNVVIANAKQALGGEFAYVFMDMAFDPNDLFGELKKFYMLSQRANVYSSILDAENNYSKKLSIKTQQNPQSNALLQLAPENIKDFKEWRLRGLTSIVPSESSEENLKPVEPTKLDKVVKKSSEAPDIETKGNPNPNEAPEGEAVPDEAPAESESEDETPPESKKETEEKPERKQRNNQTFIEEKKDISEIPIPVSKLFIEDTNDNYEQFITAVTQNIGLPNIKSEIFYKDIFSEDFYIKDRRSENTLCSLLLNKNKDDLKYKYGKLLSRIHKIVMSAPSIDSAVNQINAMTSDNNEFKLKLTDLRPYLKTGNRQIILKNSGQRTVIYLQLYHENQTDFINIPIGYTSIKKNGVYTGWFTRLTGASYTRGERMTLAQLLQKYPGLDMIDAAGILLGANVSNYTGSAQFADTNNGKSFAALGEVPISLSYEDVFKEAKSRDKVWTYEYSDVLKLAGIQQVLTPDEVTEWIVCWDYLRCIYNDETKKHILTESDRWWLNQRLAKFGLKSDTDDIIKKLVKLSGNTEWEKYKTLSDEDKKSILFGTPGFVSTPRTSGLLFASILDKILNNPEQFSDKSVWSSLRRELCTNIGDRRLWIKTKDGNVYQIVALDESQTNSEGKKNYSKEWQIQDQSGKKIAEAKYSGAVGVEFGKTLKQLLNAAGVDLNGASAMFLYKNIREGSASWDVSNTNQTLYAFLSPFILDGSYGKLFSGFKYGFYANINSDDKSERGPWKKLPLQRQLSNYSTDATNWIYATYSLDESKVQSEDVSQTTIDIIKMWDEFKSDFVKNAANNIESDLLVDIIKDFESGFDISKLNSATELVEKINNLLDIVNDQILARTDNVMTKLAAWDNDLGYVYWQNMDSKEDALNNVLAKAGLDSTINVLYSNGIDFGLYSNGSISVITYIEDGKIIGLLTGVQEQLQSILNDINLLEEGDKKTVYSYIKRVATGNNVSLEEANKIWKLRTKYNTFVARIVDYLEKRLMSEIDGC